MADLVEHAPLPHPFEASGAPLAPRLRRFFESAFGLTLGQVRIHCDESADVLNRQLGSLAFAHGEDIFFRRGAFAPETRSGLWLLAHELAHVLQQRGSTSARVAPGWTAALEREANDAACAVLNGHRVVVPPRAGCPSIQCWETDMHFAAVYLTGRCQTANHDTAMRVAVASQSLDDSDETSAPGLKIKGRSMAFGDPGPNNSSRDAVRLANNSHALGVTYDDSERVAARGISENFDLLFGLGMHTVGDYLAHANLSGLISFGHGNQPTENCSVSSMFSHDADHTFKNPRKALDTILRFIRLWARFRQLASVAPVNMLIQQAMAEFVMATDQGGKEKAFRLGAELSGAKKAQIDQAITVWNSADLRRRMWIGDEGLQIEFREFPDQGRRREASANASQFWLSKANDAFFRVGVEVEVYQRQGAWGTAFGGYPSIVPPTRICFPEPPLFPIVPYGTGN